MGIFEKLFRGNSKLLCKAPSSSPGGNLRFFGDPNTAPRVGRIHFFWAFDNAALPIPDGWTCRRTFLPDRTTLQTGRVEADFKGCLAPNLMAQARYLRRRAEVPEVLVHASDVLKELFPEASDEELASMSIPGFTPLPHGDEHKTDTGSTRRSVKDANSGKGLNAEADSDSRWITVAHLTAAVSETPTESELSEAFEECVDLVHTTHRALHHVRGFPVQLPRPESTALAAALLQVIEGGQLVTKWPPGVLLLNLYSIGVHPSLDAAELVALEEAEVKDAAHRPMSLVLDLRREALAAGYLTGDTRTAVVMVATTCETFIDVVLAALLWEEGLSPEDGAIEMERYRDTAERLWGLLAPRLGGSWDVAKVPPLRDWRRTIAASRNRVVHSGGLPGTDLAQAACNAMFPFISYIFDQVCSSRTRNKFPMTALIVAGRAGLEPRGGWTRKLRQAADEADELDLQGVFGRWYSAMAELRLPEDTRRSAQAGIMKLSVTEGGKYYWVEHDEEHNLARLLEPTSDVWVYMDAAKANPKERGGTYSFDLNPTVRARGPWIPEHRLVPGVALLRSPVNWYEPPDQP